MGFDQFCSAAQAKDIIGVTHTRVRQMCLEGEIIARKVGHHWFILRSDAMRVAREIPTTGRPRTKPGGEAGDRRNGRKR